MPFFQDIPDLVEPTSPRADGALPTLVDCTDKDQQVEIALRAARGAGKTQSVAILVKDRAQERIFSSALGANATRLHRDLQVWNDGPGIYHGTYHAAKGLEFDVVILPFLDADNLPDPDYIDSHGEEDGLTHDGRLVGLGGADAGLPAERAQEVLEGVQHAGALLGRAGRQLVGQLLGVGGVTTDRKSVV